MTRKQTFSRDTKLDGELTPNLFKNEPAAGDLPLETLKHCPLDGSECVDWVTRRST